MYGVCSILGGARYKHLRCVRGNTDTVVKAFCLDDRYDDRQAPHFSPTFRGSGLEGQIGHGGAQKRRVPGRLGPDAFGGTSVVMVSCGAAHTLALTARAEVWCVCAVLCRCGIALSPFYGPIVVFVAHSLSTSTLLRRCRAFMRLTPMSHKMSSFVTERYGVAGTAPTGDLDMAIEHINCTFGPLKRTSSAGQVSSRSQRAGRTQQP